MRYRSNSNTPLSSWAPESLPVLVLPLKLYLYSCSHVLRLFRGSHPQGPGGYCALSLWRVHIRQAVDPLLLKCFLLISSSHTYFPRVMCANAIYSLLPTSCKDVLQSEVNVFELCVADYRCRSLKRMVQKLYVYICDA